MKKINEFVKVATMMAVVAGTTFMVGCAEKTVANTETFIESQELTNDETQKDMQDFEIESGVVCENDVICNESTEGAFETSLAENEVDGVKENDKKTVSKVNDSIIKENLSGDKISKNTNNTLQANGDVNAAKNNVVESGVTVANKSASVVPAGIPTNVPKNTYGVNNKDKNETAVNVVSTKDTNEVAANTVAAKGKSAESASTSASAGNGSTVVQYESSVRYVEGKGWYGRNGQYLGKYRYGNGKGENFYSDSIEDLDAMAEANRQEYLNSLTVSVELNRNVDAEINKIRVANGKNPTTNSDKLDEEALRRAAELYEQGKDDVNKISHEGSGYLENIQGNTCGGATDEQVVKNYDESLMHSAQQKSGSHATSSSATAYVKDADGNVVARYDVTVFGDDVDPADNPDFYVAPDVLEKEREWGMISDEDYEKFKAKNETLDEDFANILFGDYSNDSSTSEPTETEVIMEE